MATTRGIWLQSTDVPPYNYVLQARFLCRQDSFGMTKSTLWLIHIFRQLLRLAQPLLRIRRAATLCAAIRRLGHDLRQQPEVIFELRLRPVANLFRGFGFVAH